MKARIVICKPSGQRLAPKFTKEPSMARSIDTVELRGQVDKAVMDVLDACSIARGIDRISLDEKVLSDWAARKVSEASVLQRIARGNPAVMDLAGIKQDECGV